MQVKRNCDLSRGYFIFFLYIREQNFIATKQVFYTDKYSVVIPTVLFLYSPLVQKKAIKRI